MGKIISVFLFIITSIANADDAIYIGQLSNHLYESKHIVRESHPLIIYETNNNVLYGYWKNSFNKNTFIYGKKRNYIKDSLLGVNYNAGHKIGLATGYRTPVFFTFYVQSKWIDLNWLPGNWLVLESE